MKSTIAAALLAAGLLSQANAQTVVYLTGSTAFRGLVYNALVSRTFDATPTIGLRKYTAGKESGASYMVFHGNISGTPYIINCAWSGSEAGIASVAGVTIDNDGNALPGSPETWLLPSITDQNTAAPTTGELEGSSRQGDLAFADTSQAVSLTPNTGGSTALKHYGTPSAGPVGVVAFTWVKNYNPSSPSPAWTAMQNITWPQVNVLLSAGNMPSAYFTGNPLHTQYVYLVGRNKGSGTRANALADHGYGTTHEVTQYSIGGGVSTSTTGLLDLQYEGNDGYESGGGVAAALKIPGSCTQTDPINGGPVNGGWFAVGYLGTGDATSTELSPNWLTLDGVVESDGAIEEGQYSFWGYEHLYGRNGISGLVDAAGAAIWLAVKAEVDTKGGVATDHSGGIGLSFMHCSKASDVAFPVR